MRKSFIFILLLVLLLSGCGSKPQENTPSGPTEAPPENVTEPPLEGSTNEKTEEIGRNFPEDLDAFFRENEIEGLEFWILQDMTDFDFSDYTRDVNMLGSNGAYFGRKYDITPEMRRDHAVPFVEYILGSWPDLSDKGSYVTNIWITDPDVKIYGLTLENTMEEWRTVLTEKGYSFGGYHGDYRADMIAVSPDGTYIICYDSNPLGLSIIAPTTNREGIVND